MARGRGYIIVDFATPTGRMFVVFMACANQGTRRGEWQESCLWALPTKRQQQVVHTCGSSASPEKGNIGRRCTRLGGKWCGLRDIYVAKRELCLKCAVNRTDWHLVLSNTSTSKYIYILRGVRFFTTTLCYTIT